jgi:hypothetical protein
LAVLRSSSASFLGLSSSASATRPARASLSLFQTMKITSDSQSLASGPGGRVGQRNRPDICKNTWYFTFNLQVSLASEVGVASQLESVASSQYRKQALTTASIISFSSSADGSPEIRGFISGGSMWQRTVQTWLTGPAISNLQLHPIARRCNDPKILLFLADSTLPMGLRLRMDTMGPSDAPRARRQNPGVAASVAAGAAAGPRVRAGALGGPRPG